MDLVVSASIILAFATLVTAHVALAAGLVARRPWWRGPVALVVAPLAPYWGFRERMRARAAVWGAAFVVYIVARIIGG